MHRRRLIATGIALSASATMLSRASAQTPVGTPEITDEAVDMTTRDLVSAMYDLHPTDLLTALESADVTTDQLLAVTDGQPLTSRPWADYSDTDLYNSLGGVALTLDERSLHDPNAEMLGAYIVYESPDIAYQELVRKLADMGDLMNNPSMTQSTSGVNVWILESDGLQIGTTRIGYVHVMGLLGRPDDVMGGMINHLAEVAAFA